MVLGMKGGYGCLIPQADKGAYPIPDREPAEDQPWCNCELVFAFCRNRAVYTLCVVELELAPEVRATIELYLHIPNDRYSKFYFVSLRHTAGNGGLHVCVQMTSSRTL